VVGIAKYQEDFSPVLARETADVPQKRRIGEMVDGVLETVEVQNPRTKIGCRR
jgi:hypothetical protein